MASNFHLYRVIYCWSYDWKISGSRLLGRKKSKQVAHLSEWWRFPDIANQFWYKTSSVNRISFDQLYIWISDPSLKAIRIQVHYILGNPTGIPENAETQPMDVMGWTGSTILNRSRDADAAGWFRKSWTSCTKRVEADLETPRICIIQRPCLQYFYLIIFNTWNQHEIRIEIRRKCILFEPFPVIHSTMALLLILSFLSFPRHFFHNFCIILRSIRANNLDLHKVSDGNVFN